MALNMAVNQRPQYLDLNGNPLSMGRVTYFDVGTQIEKSVFADPEGTTELANPLLLDAGGFVPVSSVFYGEGDYTVRVEYVVNPGDSIPVYAEEYEIPRVVGTATPAIVGNVVEIEAVEDLINLDMGSNIFVRCSQYYDRSEYDFGGGLFKWYSASTAGTDLGMVFAYSGNAVGRFFRIGDGVSVKTSWYGVTSNTGSSMNNRILQAASYCNADRPTLEFTEGLLEVVGDLAVTSSSIHINQGVRFKKFDTELAYNVIFDGQSLTSDSIDSSLVNSVAGDENVTFLNPRVKTYPEWWGTVSFGDDYTAFFNMQGSLAQLQIKNPYTLTGVGSPSSNIVLPNIKLLEGGYIVNDIDSLTINKCVSEEDASYSFRTTDNDYSNYVFNFVGHGQWFMDSTMDDTHASSVLDAVTTNHMIWDKPGIYEIDKFGSLNKVYTHQVSPGSYFKMTAGGNIGSIDAGLYRIFEADSTVPSHVNTIVKGAWFGAERWASSPTTTAGIVNAIKAAEDGTVDFGGVRLTSTSAAVITSVGPVTIKNLNVTFNGTGTIIQLVDSICKFVDCKLDSFSSDATSEVEFINSDFVFDIHGYDMTVLGTDIKFTGCRFSSNQASNTGTITIGSVASSATTEHVVFNDNIQVGGRLYITTGTKSNEINYNRLDGFSRHTEIGTQSLMIVRNAVNTTIIGNTISCLYDGIVADETIFISFVGISSNIVTGLRCVDNNFNLTTTTGANQHWKSFSASGFANEGHVARVSNNIFNGFEISHIGTDNRGIVKSPGSNSSEWLQNSDFIFPWQIGSWSVGDDPLYFVSGVQNGYSVAGGQMGPALVEAQGITGSGGACTTSTSMRLLDAPTYGGTRIMVYISVENTSLLL